MHYLADIMAYDNALCANLNALVTHFVHLYLVVLRQPNERIQIEKDYTAFDTRTTGREAQFIPVYTKLYETFRLNTSLTGCYNVSYSYYCLLYRCRVDLTISEHQWEVVVCCSRPSVVSCVIGNAHQLVRGLLQRTTTSHWCSLIVTATAQL